MQNKKINAINIGFNNKIEINLVNKKYSLPNLAVSPPCNYFLGRETDLEKIHQALSSSETGGRLQICAIGGIGKSEIISKYCMKYNECYSEIHYWQWPDNCSQVEEFKKSWVNSISFEENENIDIVFNKILNDLYYLKPEGQLLVVDNIPENIAPDLEYFAINFFNHLKCSVLLGSRKIYSTFPVYILEHLDEISCKKLFEYFYDTPIQQFEEEEFKTLLKWCDYHTLTIELIAITLRYVGKDIKWLICTLKNKGFNFSELKVKPYRYTTNNETILNHISLLFNIQEACSKKQLIILKNLSILPSTYIDKDKFLKWLIVDYELYQNELFKVVDRGYIKYVNGSIKMHPLISELILKKDPPTWPECKNLVRSFVVEVRTNLSKREHPSDKRKLIPLAKNLIQYFKNTNDIHIAKLCEKVGYYYFCMRFDEIAKDYYEIAICVYEKLKKHPILLADCLNKLALSLRRLEDYDKALLYHEEALKKYNMIKTPPTKIAEVYNDMALVFYEQGVKMNNIILLKKSLKFLKISLKIAQQHYSKKYNPDIATTLNNFGLVYYELGEIKKSLSLFKISYRKRMQLLGNNHVDTAISQRNIGFAYYKLHNPLCIDILENALNKLEPIFGSDDVDIIHIKNLLKKIKKQ